jgi:hypothetical protein
MVLILIGSARTGLIGESAEVTSAITVNIMVACIVGLSVQQICVEHRQGQVDVRGLYESMGEKPACS